MFRRESARREEGEGEKEGGAEARERDEKRSGIKGMRSYDARGEIISTSEIK